MQEKVGWVLEGAVVLERLGYAKLGLLYLKVVFGGWAAMAHLSRGPTCVERMDWSIGVAMIWLQFLQVLAVVSRHRQRMKNARRETTARMAWLVM
jgi:hypothetical protein